MAIIHADDFSMYAAGNNMLEGVWTLASNAAIVASPDPLETSIKVMRVSTNQIVYSYPAPTATTGVAFRRWFSALGGASNVPVLAFLDNLGNHHLSIRVLPNGQLQLYRGTSRATAPILLAETAAAVLTASAFHHWEAKAYIHATVGTFELRLNGYPVISYTGNTLGGTNPTIASIAYESWTTNNDFVKDFVAWDTSGARNNNFLGTVYTRATVPNSDVAFPWTPSTGTTGYTLVDELPSSDVDFMSAALPAPAAAEFGLTDLPNDVTTVRAIVVMARARKTDGGDGNLQMGIKRAGTASLGANRPLTTAFTYWRDVFETDPVTGTTITLANFNAMTITADRKL